MRKAAYQYLCAELQQWFLKFMDHMRTSSGLAQESQSCRYLLFGARWAGGGATRNIHFKRGEQ
jgi:hypothetical protein